MNKKNTVKKTVAMLLAMGLTLGTTACNFIVTDSQKDLAQIVAKVDITSNLKTAENETLSADVQAIIKNGGITTDIPKRDLVAYFLNIGLTYVQSYGYTYEQAFTQLMDMLVNRKILTQYAVAHYLKDGFADGTKPTAAACNEYVNKAIEEATGKTKELLKANRGVLTMKYFLTEGGKADKMEDYNTAVYNLMKSLNGSLDSAEANYITETEEHEHGESRTTPTNVNTTKTEYIPLTSEGELDYDIYTGRNTVNSCGTYEKVDGSTATSRKKAYNMFLSNLQGYGLINKNEDTAVVTELNYYYVELTSTLEQALINKYYEDLKDKAIESVSVEYMASRYDEIYNAQKLAYGKNVDAFTTALDGVSDTSFLLYGEKNFGFVYNILLPFSAAQEQAYAALKNKGLDEDGVFNARKKLLADIEAKDLRESWITDDEHTNYAYEATTAFDNGKAKGDKTYLFFEDNLTNTEEYETIKHYAGLYPFNAKYDEAKDKFVPNKLKIGTATEDGFIQEMESYIDYVLGAEGKAKPAGKAFNPDYNETTYSTNGVVDYSKFIYYEGKVELANTSPADYFNPEADAYKALSAVNELMFAYSTDTGCLNTYMGYAVSPYKTNFVPEFEYAAQYAVEKGVGSYVVAPSDYGWHIIYTAYKFEGDNVYGNPFVAADDAAKARVQERVDTEGTFENLFYESLKATSATNYTTDVENKVLNGYKTSATRYVERYKDLLELD